MPIDEPGQRLWKAENDRWKLLEALVMVITGAVVSIDSGLNASVPSLSING